MIEFVIGFALGAIVIEFVKAIAAARWYDRLRRMGIWIQVRKKGDP